MQHIWDVVVIGGGPAGMMAAGRAAERGLSVLLIEKNETLGKKLLITGGGRCNVTNGETDIRTLLSIFGKHDQFLYSAFSQFGVSETLGFFHKQGMETVEEPGKRIFPKSNKSQSVWDAVVGYMKAGNVCIRSNSSVMELLQEDRRIIGLRTTGGEFIPAKQVVVATGGLSRPETGSTGEGFAWLHTLGHRINTQHAAIVPLKIKEQWVSSLQGVTLDLVTISIIQFGKKQFSKRGRFLFTHFGVSGPTVLNVSSKVGELLSYGDVYLSLDLLPSFDLAKLNFALQELINLHKNKLFRNVLDTLLPKQLIPILLEQCSIDPETPCHSLTRASRVTLIGKIKKLDMTVSSLMGLDKAVITSGGVDLNEIDFRTMSSRLYPNLYIVGDMLDIDRPSGGYSLQLCWTTGWVAGNSVKKR